MSAAELLREIQRRLDDHPGVRQSPGYAAGYGVGLARRLAGKKPTLNILADHNVPLAEFMARVDAHGGEFGEAVNAVLDEIERGGQA